MLASDASRFPKSTPVHPTPGPFLKEKPSYGVSSARGRCANASSFDIKLNRG
jgi:hypothetical protein